MPFYPVVKAACDAFLYIHDVPAPFSTGRLYGLPVRIEIVDKTTGKMLIEVSTPKRRTQTAREEFLWDLKQRADRVSSCVGQGGSLILYFTAQFDTFVNVVAAPDAPSVVDLPKNWNPWIDYNSDGLDMVERCKHVAYYAAGMGKELEVICRNPLRGDIRVFNSV
jgi:hypothetical protein